MIFCTKTYICLKNFQVHFTRRALTRTPGWYIRASFHILILIISLVVLLAYLFKIRYAYFTGGHICQPYRVEKVERDRFAAEDRESEESETANRMIFHVHTKETWIFPNKEMNSRVSALLGYELYLLANTVCLLLQPNILLFFCAEKAFTNLCQEVINVHRYHKIFFVLAPCKWWNSTECREERLAR